MSIFFFFFFLSANQNLAPCEVGGRHPARQHVVTQLPGRLGLQTPDAGSHEGFASNFVTSLSTSSSRSGWHSGARAHTGTLLRCRGVELLLRCSLSSSGYQNAKLRAQQAPNQLHLEHFEGINVLFLTVCTLQQEPCFRLQQDKR